MSSLRPAECPFSGEAEARLVFSYDAPPPGEIGFKRPEGEPYRREVWQFERSRHFVSRHAMAVATDYDGAYMDATYSDEAGIAKTFERIVSLPADKSDNSGRVARVRVFAEEHFGKRASPTLLDIGAGLGVFPYGIRQLGWDCTAVDPDARAVRHLRSWVGVDAVQGDFMVLDFERRYDIITFNKVLEHLEQPVDMLSRAHDVLAEGGLVYLELPDGEMAARDGPAREEFFIEHHHVFSFASVAMLATRAGFDATCVERLREPSSKYTLRAFLTATP